MQDLAWLFLLASAVVATAPPASMSEPRAIPGVQSAQLGGTCVTPTRSCPTPPRPINSQCFCGKERGVVRP